MNVIEPDDRNICGHAQAKVLQSANGADRRHIVECDDRIQRRKRKPIANAALGLWNSCLNNWINPNIEDLPLSEVNKHLGNECFEHCVKR